MEKAYDEKKAIADATLAEKKPTKKAFQAYCADRNGIMHVPGSIVLATAGTMGFDIDEKDEGRQMEKTDPSQWEGHDQYWISHLDDDASDEQKICARYRHYMLFVWAGTGNFPDFEWCARNRTLPMFYDRGFWRYAPWSKNSVYHAKLTARVERAAEMGGDMVPCPCLIHKADKCEKIVKQAELHEHLQRVHFEGKAFPCYHCGERFATVEERKAHEEDHRRRQHKMPARNGRQPETFTKPVQGYLCDKCGKSFSTPRDLLRHIVPVHLNRKLFGCGKCNKRFSEKGHLTAHTKEFHSGKERETFTCSTCNKTFKSKRSLQGCQDKHSGRHTCDTCSKTFRTAAHLKEHERTHTGEKPFKCPHCEYAARRQHHLTLHIRRMHG